MDKQLKIVKNSYTLEKEISYATSLFPSKAVHLVTALTSLSISSLTEVTVPILISYNRFVFREFFGKQNKYSSYKGDLECAMFSYFSATGHTLFKMPFPVVLEDSVYKKLLVYLIASGITSFDQIDDSLRYSYGEYVQLTVPKKATSHTKGMDLLKLSLIKSLSFTRTPHYDNTLFYLAYYPDYEIAHRFFYTARKEFLFFDFTRSVPENMKRQIFSCLMETLQTKKECSNHLLLQHYITPLYYFYDFCCEMHIEDIQKITRKETDRFPEYLSTHMDAISKSATQVLYRVRKQLFLSAKVTDFSSYVWFLERFTLEETRVNPTRTIDAFYFDNVENPFHREIFQNYMKYLLVLSPKYSLRKILMKYYMVKDFLRFLDERNILLSALTESTIKEFISYRADLELQPETFNTTLIDLSSFLHCVALRENLQIPDFSFDYYLKKTFTLHHDRSVPEDEVDAILTILYKFPESLGLMFLTLYSTGLRINEVCSLKRDALFMDNGTCFLKTYQYKMRTEKVIPIPEDLYFLLTRYLKRTDSSLVYIFPSIKNANKPFQAATFSKQMKTWLKKYRLTDHIDFRSHDYRHTIATDLYDSGAGLPTTREFVGHKDENMTKKYIDHRPSKIDRLQQQYFSENDL